MTAKKLINMLSYKRPQGSKHQELFCKRFIEPLMGKPDKHGNYIKIIGDKPNVSFMSHHDTVHREGGFQSVFLDNGLLSSDGDCLGADCTVGVWLMLEMIKANVSGVYVIHASEEIGCLGSRALVDDKPEWLDSIDFAISFDRKGVGSIITHQMGLRCCSETFSESLSDILNLGHTSDNTGSYTDSNEYIYNVSECTNLSVGYYNQHTNKETQDLVYALQLRDRLISADWSKLVSERIPGDYEFDEKPWYGWNNEENSSHLSLKDYIDLYPDETVLALESLGVSVDMLKEEINFMFST